MDYPLQRSYVVLTLLVYGTFTIFLLVLLVRLFRVLGKLDRVLDQLATFLSRRNGD